MTRKGAVNVREWERERITVHVDSAISDIIPLFLENRHEDIRAMLRALEHRDYDIIRFLGCTMRGAGGGYGLDGITTIGDSLAQAARKGNSREIRRLVGELSAYLNHLEVLYDDPGGSSHLESNAG